jgi:hypothetical protein
VEEDELGTQYDNEQLADVSANEPIAYALQDEDEKHRRIRRAKNAKHAQCRHNTQNRAHEPRDLNNAFAAVADRVPYADWRHRRSSTLSSTTPIQSLDTKSAVLDPARAHATQWATSSVSPRNQLSSSEQHGDTTLVCHTPRGGHGSQRNDNRQHNEGHPSTRDNNEQEVQQPPATRRHHGQDPL